MATSDRNSPQTDFRSRHERISEAAYYRSESRGFGGNRELDDWLEAEKHIDSLSAGGGVKNELANNMDTTNGMQGSDGDVLRTDLEQAQVRPEDVQQRAKEFGVPAHRLREAIKEVGPMEKDIRAYFRAGNADGKAR